MPAMPLNVLRQVEVDYTLPRAEIAPPLLLLAGSDESAMLMRHVAGHIREADADTSGRSSSGTRRPGDVRHSSGAPSSRATPSAATGSPKTATPGPCRPEAGAHSAARPPSRPAVSLEMSALSWPASSM